MARRKKGRDIDGILLLDKPVGCSSNHALQRVRRLFDARKAGHTGSLDPLASGLLPICLGEATKLSTWLLDADKRYRVSAALDHETDTGDREGQPTRHNEAALPTQAQLLALTQRFIGEQQQIPPMYSALKRDGRPLYELARAGVAVTREPRRITVHALAVLDYADNNLTLDVTVSRGTYIRTLVEDLARAWGGAAHVAALRRTSVGPFAAPAMHGFATLEELAAAGTAALDELLLAPSAALPDWPQAVLPDTAVSAIRQGRSVPAGGEQLPAPGWVRIMAASGDFLGLGQLDQHGRLAPKRMFTRALR
ncbi:MAG TPA: tRNA pseudouridine(55) synthase TruB [Salinisphaeraceae bacterium]|nr:tRNA pseudouridine(55) synthase TruB [Salinisphaeraceae bacterium]